MGADPKRIMADDPTQYCAQQGRRFDHDRCLCTMFAREPVQARLFALYAFNVEIARVREIVSEPVIGQMRLQWWRDAITEFAAGPVRGPPGAPALARALGPPPGDPRPLAPLLSPRAI